MKTLKSFFSQLRSLAIKLNDIRKADSLLTRYQRAGIHREQHVLETLDQIQSTRQCAAVVGCAQSRSQNRIFSELRSTAPLY